VGTKEFELRQGIYEGRLEEVQGHNSNPDRRWNAVVNHLSDRTKDELSQLRGLRAMQSTKRGKGVVGAHSSKGQFLGQIKVAVLPEEKSWEHLAAVQAETDQGACGSCWAIATAVMLQANAEIYGHNRTFATQELVSCVPNPHSCGGSGGCQGATVELGMNWIMEQGLDTNAGTPYMAKDMTCKKRSAVLITDAGVGSGSSLEDMIAVGFHGAKSHLSPSMSFGLKGWERLPENEYEPLMRAVAERGPVAVSVGADGWNSYGAGVFDSCGKDSTIDHAVTLIGYGIDKARKEKFWTIKNSWGSSWGENGKIRLLRQEGNVHCGTDSQPKVGTGCDGGPSEVHVCGMCGILYDAVVPHFQ